MKFGLGLAVLLGLALAAALVAYQGADLVLGALWALGWGFVLIVLVHLVQMACSALGWRPLIGFMLFGAMLGIAPEAGLALSLAKRLRELLLGLPAIAAWQYVEGRRLFAGRRQPSASAGKS